MHRGLPVLNLRGWWCRKADRDSSRDHYDRSNRDQQLSASGHSNKFAKHQRAPRQAPKLIRIGKRNAAPDAEVFRRILLEQIADYPAESAEERPEKHWP